MNTNLTKVHIIYYDNFSEGESEDLACLSAQSDFHQSCDQNCKS